MILDLLIPFAIALGVGTGFAGFVWLLGWVLNLIAPEERRG